MVPYGPTDGPSDGLLASNGARLRCDHLAPEEQVDIFAHAVLRETPLPGDQYAHVVQARPDPRRNGAMGWFTLWVNDADTLFHALTTGYPHTDNIYIGLGTRPKGGSRERVQKGNAQGMLWLGADVDIFDPPIHAKAGLPSDLDSAIALLEAVMPTPSLLLKTGHGAQALWVLSEPWLWGKDGTERARAQALLNRWHTWLAAAAQERGYVLDNTAHLNQVLRAPGTVNHKLRDGQPERHPVTLLWTSDARYSVEQLAEQIGFDLAGAAADDSGTAGATSHSSPASHVGGAGADDDDDSRTGRYREPDFGASDMADSEVLQRCRNDARGKKFREIFDEGNLTSVGGDFSRGDYTIWGHLTFYCWNNPDQIARLAEQGEHYRCSKDPKTAEKRRKKWGRAAAFYGTHQRAMIAKLLATIDKASLYRGGEKSAQALGAPSASGQARTVISVKNPLAAKVDLTLDALARENDPALGEPAIFVHGGVLAEVGASSDKTGLPTIRPMTPTGVAVYADRVVTYIAPGLFIDTRVEPPQRVIDGVLAQKSLAARIPALRGITETPVLRPDGSVLDTEGYDVATQLLYRPAHGAAPVDPITAAPSDEEIAATWEVLHEPFRQFPFVSPADEANTLALLVTVALRGVLAGANIPLAIATAPTLGSGKTMLMETIAAIGLGHKVGALTEVLDDMEWRKKLTGEMMSGEQFHLIDNLDHAIGSGQLAALLTISVWRDRLLGTNQTVSIPKAEHGIWAATGNNVALVGDLSRRCYVIRLDPQKPKPWLYEPGVFDHDPLDEGVEAERPALLHALLTACRGWFARGCPTEGAPTLGSFERWVSTVYGVLSLDPKTCVGADGATRPLAAYFLANSAEWTAQADIATDDAEVFVRALAQSFGTSPFLAADIERNVERDSYGAVIDPDLRQALPLEVAKHLREGGLSQRLGRYFAKIRGHRYGAGADQLCVEKYRDDLHSKTAEWCVRSKGLQTDGAPTPRPATGKGSLSSAELAQAQTPRGGKGRLY